MQDYLDFLEELAAEYSNTPLNAADKNYAIEVISHLESQQNVGCVRNMLSVQLENLKSDAPY